MLIEWGGDDVAGELSLAGDEFGVESGMEDAGGFGGVGVAQQIEQGQAVEGAGTALLRGAEFAGGVAEEDVEIGGIGDR